MMDDLFLMKEFTCSYSRISIINWHYFKNKFICGYNEVPVWFNWIKVYIKVLLHCCIFHKNLSLIIWVLNLPSIFLTFMFCQKTFYRKVYGGNMNGDLSLMKESFCSDSRISIWLCLKKKSIFRKNHFPILF